MGEIEVGDYIVEWDDRKAEINKKKHKVNFETAVVYTERQEKYRLISARLADRDEKEKYYGQYSYL